MRLLTTICITDINYSRHYIDELTYKPRWKIQTTTNTVNLVTLT